MLIILDIGANDGCSIRKFKEILNEKNITDYKIYSFEPVPFFKKYLELEKCSNVELIYKICSTDNKKKKIYLSGESGSGSSIYKDKLSNKIRENIFIHCESIDLCDFIKNLPQYSQLWIKMDVEGAEYKLIPHLYNNNLLSSIDKLYIEWHYKKIRSITEKQHNETVKMLGNLKCEFWMTEPKYRVYDNNKYLKTLR